jgi:hypothetical protein
MYPFRAQMEQLHSKLGWSATEVGWMEGVGGGLRTHDFSLRVVEWWGNGYGVGEGAAVA